MMSLELTIIWIFLAISIKGSVVTNREATLCKTIGAHKTLNHWNNVIRNRFYKMHKICIVFWKQIGPRLVEGKPSESSAIMLVNILRTSITSGRMCVRWCIEASSHVVLPDAANWQRDNALVPASTLKFILSYLYKDLAMNRPYTVLAGPL